jgi:hypothetical protein
LNVKYTIKGALALLPLAAVAFVGSSEVRGSSHAEAPAIAQDPQVDNTDVWAWKDSPTTITIMTGWNPLRSPFGGPNYDIWSDTALYEIHIDNNNDGVEDVTYQFQFKSIYKNGGSFLRITSAAAGYASPTSADDPGQNFRQTYSVTRVDGKRRTGQASVVGQDFPVAPPNVGPKFTPNYENIAASNTASTSAVRTTSDGCKVFVGPRQEAFFIDLGAAFDKLTIRDLDTRGNVGNLGGGVNSLSGFNIDVIAIQIPIANLGVNAQAAGAQVGVWSSSSRRQVSVLKPGGQGKVTEGRWVQVSRLGNPLMNELFIPLELKDQWNASEPTADLDPNGPFQKYFLDPEPAKLLKALYNLPVPPAPRKDLAVLLPDTLKVRLDINPLKADDAAFLGNAAGPLLGRTLADDVVDIYLQAAAGALVQKVPPLGDGVDWATSGVRIFKDQATGVQQFPYMGAPYSGLDGFDGDNSSATATENYVGPNAGFQAGRTTTFMKVTPRK